MNLKDFIKQNSDGTFEYDDAAFTSALDRERTQASDTARKNAEQKLRVEIEKELKAKLEEEAKLTAEEKLKKDMEAFAQQKRDFDKQRITTIYKDAGISDAEIEYLTTLIGDDSDKNIETAQKFAEARKTANEEYKKKLTEEFQTSGSRPKDGEGSGGESVVSKLAKEFSTQPTAGGYVDLKGDSTDVKI